MIVTKCPDTVVSSLGLAKAKLVGATIHEERKYAILGLDTKTAGEIAISRKIELSHSKLRVEDQIYGSFNKAVLRWRLIPGSWSLKKENKAIVIKNKSLFTHYVLRFKPKFLSFELNYPQDGNPDTT